MSAWSHLPNAQYIDRVLESVKIHPEIWYAALNAASNAAWYAALNAAGDAARDAARSAAGRAACYAAGDAPCFAAWYAASALIAYDDSAKYLDMTSERLRIWATLSEDPAAILLIPAVIAFEKINELETA